MDQLPVDVEERRAIVIDADDMLVPDLIVQGLGDHGAPRYET
jgi:hypothetical protein